MKENKKEDMSGDELLVSLILAPFEMLNTLVKIMFIIMAILLLFAVYGFYDCYKRPKCNVCNRYAEIGEYCSHCGILMTDSTTYRNKMVHPWQVVD